MLSVGSQGLTEVFYPETDVSQKLPIFIRTQNVSKRSAEGEWVRKVAQVRGQRLTRSNTQRQGLDKSPSWVPEPCHLPSSPLHSRVPVPSRIAWLRERAPQDRSLPSLRATEIASVAKDKGLDNWSLFRGFPLDAPLTSATLASNEARGFRP